MAYISLGQMARASIALTVFVALALSSDPAAAAKKKKAAAKPKPQIQVQVSVVNNSPTRAKGVFQSTDAGDFGTNCTVEANPSGLPNIGCASKLKTYTNPPKNIKNLLCIFEKFGVQYTSTCQKLMDSVPNCKRNNIFTSLCGTAPGGPYAVNVVPACIYRTVGAQQGLVTWTWTLSAIAGNFNTLTVDCAMDGYSGVTKK